MIKTRTYTNVRSLGTPLAVLLALATVGANASPPTTLELTGVVRDFKGVTQPGGHVDFERAQPGGTNEYAANLVTPVIGADRKPVYNPITGTQSHRLVNAGRTWKDSAGRNICQLLWNPNAPFNDMSPPGQYGAFFQNIASANSFASWFNDTLDVNLSAPLTITLSLVGTTYVFDSALDPLYAARGGFFPIDGQLYGNYLATGHNFHFTFELHCRFTYSSMANQVFKFTGDDDVWVYINDRLVIDLGGTHRPRDQYVDLNRLGLTSGTSYTLDFFSAERHTNGSNVRIETNLELTNPPTTLSVNTVGD